jgi:hypothetical protein
MRSFNGRYSAAIDGAFVVFLIGMRVNRIWKIHRWLPVAMAMGPMLQELMRNPSRGLLGFRVLPGLRSITLIQYWRSFEQLERFARDRGSAHLPAWARFNRAVGTGGDVGIWHETYLVPAGAYEAIYSNMPRIGLAAAADHVPVWRRGQSAAYRIGRAVQDEPGEPVPPEPAGRGQES